MLDFASNNQPAATLSSTEQPAANSDQRSPLPQHLRRIFSFNIQPNYSRVVCLPSYVQGEFEFRQRFKKNEVTIVFLTDTNFVVANHYHKPSFIFKPHSTSLSTAHLPHWYYRLQIVSQPILFLHHRIIANAVRTVPFCCR